ncbi:MAG: hypothetical protein JWN70_5743 [Planctomycetaceae bacterium]|nr:hypothetical protein [Planctomycetaceae bacterium]
MHFSRREFLGVSIGAAAPGIFQAAALAAPASNQPGGKQTILVIVQLAGGNDGLNTVIPLRDPAYAAARTALKPDLSQVRKINDDVGFYPTAAGFSELLQQNQLTLLQGVGYPQPNRSHFESMDIWHKATAATTQSYGWLGRTAPLLGTAGTALQIGTDPAPLCLKGPTGPAPALNSLADYQLKVAEKGDDPAKRKVIEQLAVSTKETETGSLRDLLRKSALQSYRSAASLRRVNQSYDTPVNYPTKPLARQLKLIAQLIDADVSERIYFTSLGGFDTHADQPKSHPELLAELSTSLAAFHADLKHHGHDQRVVALTFSEFGRRVKENGSQGTEHGAAGPVFLTGGKVKAGVHGAHPSLTDLDDGDLKFHTDFRSIYATLLDDWLGVSSREILGENFPKLPIWS